MNMHDVMIDNETLDTLPSAVMLSVGAVRFNQFSDDMDDSCFYAVIDIQDQINLGRTISADTLKFWMQQSAKAREVFFDKGAMPLREAMEAFVMWVSNGGGKTNPWSMGATFDVPMIEHACRSLGIEVPWNFWKIKCMRHHKELPGAKDVYDSIPRLGTHHNALDDAIHQARAAQAITKKLFPGSWCGPAEVIPLNIDKKRKKA